RSNPDRDPFDAPGVQVRELGAARPEGPSFACARKSRSGGLHQVPVRVDERLFPAHLGGEIDDSFERASPIAVAWASTLRWIACRSFTDCVTCASFAAIRAAWVCRPGQDLDPEADAPRL